MRTDDSVSVSSFHSSLCALSQIAIMPAEQRAALRKGTAPYAKPHACPRCAAAFTLVYASCAPLVSAIGAAAGAQIRREQWVAIVLAV